jgi:hypothetical protein
MTLKTFRGLIADDTQDTIVLHTNNGSTGYRIKKFELFPYAPGGSGTNSEHTVQIWSVAQSTIDIVTDFSNQELLGAGMMAVSASGVANPSILNVIFDNMTFNQDIYITHKESAASSEPINYYIELEQIKLDLNENTVATLKDIRNVTDGLV